MILRGDWPDYIKPGARKAFRDSYPELPAQYPALYSVLTSQRAFEEHLVSTGLGTAVLKPEGVDVMMDKPFHRGKVRFDHLTYGLGYEATEEIAEDDLYNIVVPPSSRALGRSIRDTEERIAAGPFNNAFSTQLGYDGVSIINTAHPTATSATQSNRPATDVDLSMTALQAALESFMDMENDRGLKIKLMPRWLVISPANVWLAHELLESEFAPFTADNTKNIVASMGGLTPFVYNYLTDADAWYVIADKGGPEFGFVFFWRRRPTFDDDFDKKAGVLAFYVKARFSVGVTDWRGIYGSSGA